MTEIACECAYMCMCSFSILLSLFNFFGNIVLKKDCLFGIVVSMYDYHPRCSMFNSCLYPRNFSGSVGSGTGSTQTREENWVAT